mmetsp:Transcript_22851/g.42735  ORF Transcript_22851/g.42735 Transcript_22851/m.42735 type:complete len:201 (+) Transcript_22851:973-1575(+)
MNFACVSSKSSPVPKPLLGEKSEEFCNLRNAIAYMTAPVESPETAQSCTPSKSSSSSSSSELVDRLSLSERLTLPEVFTRWSFSYSPKLPAKLSLAAGSSSFDRNRSAFPGLLLSALSFSSSVPAGHWFLPSDGRFSSVFPAFSLNLTSSYPPGFSSSSCSVIQISHTTSPIPQNRAEISVARSHWPSPNIYTRIPESRK